MTAEPVALDALGPNGPYRSRKRLTIPDVAGAPTAELSLVPALFVGRAMVALRKARPLPQEHRLAALSRAGRIFREQEVGGLSYEEYERTVSRICGVPLQAVRSAADEIADSAERVLTPSYNARPTGAVSDWRHPLTRIGRAVWTRRGEVLAVNAAGNHPAPHALWLEALALGYRVAVRPSRREPFTPHRLVTALRAAGFGDDQVVLLPTDHSVADEVMAGADLSISYGGDDVVQKYAADTTVLAQGPGRSKILVTADADWREHLDTIVDSVAHHGGVKCVNTTAVFVEGDPAPLAAAIAERLAALPSLPPEDEKAVLPVQPAETARNLERYLLAQAAGTTAHLGGDGVVEELPDGSAVLRPAVHELTGTESGQHRVELSFPCVWVAPWSPADGIASLRETLVLGVITGDEESHADLIDALVEDPSICNVHLGDHPTHWMDRSVPHDGYLGEFLMRTKTVIRG
ncbi:acyl-CoA reductase-like NAD-dependent aldehyde dehydrogenase [Streptomyces sp. V4I23]|uniref:aldehyde dehydrogenase family protein n=1 Tax=Streptomyces sp. V4I23 TaxID=3042282 RepID=UPI002786D3CE|nr:aldehyde dehydrogenase family protein [Streptomyces sp. V4I23]MDQ1009259.1 acyl-CoA reductase-like NAD-dependent aldehyde dehydrogenase [Streptomyces sp. V4I23]